MTIHFSVKLKQIGAFMLLSLVTSLTLISLSYIESRNTTRQEVEKRLLSEARRLSFEYETWINKQLLELSAITRFIDMDYSPESYRILAEESERLGFNSMSPADLNGILHLEGGKTADLSKREYLQKVLTEKVPAVSDPVYSAVEGEEGMLTILLAVPIFRDGDLKGALIGQKQASVLNGVLRSVDNGPGSSNFLISRYPYPIAHTDPAEVEKKFDLFAAAEKDPDFEDLAAIIRKMINREEGIGAYTFDGRAKYLAYTPVGDLDWTLAISIPVSTALASLEKLFSRMILTGLISILLGLVSAVLLGRTLANPIRLISRNINTIASGDADLTKRIAFKQRNDEIGQLVNGFNNFIEKLHTIITSLKNSQDSLSSIGMELSTNSQESASAISQIMANIEGVRNQTVKQSESAGAVASVIEMINSSVSALEKAVENQVSSSAQATSSIEEMVGNINMVNQNVMTMSQSFSQLIQSAEKGRTTQKEAASHIQGISSQSALLMEANQVIAGIASQTNLLAMNAAIEAAHAGEAGKGFSVVADEIRKLSETSTEQSRTIGAQLSAIEKSISRVVDVSRESDAAYNTIISEIVETDSLVKQVEQAMNEQKEGSRQILEAIRLMNESGSSVRENSERMKEETRKTALAMNDLNGITELLRSSMDEMASGAGQINASAQTVSSLAEETSRNIGNMEQVIGEFKV